MNWPSIYLCGPINGRTDADCKDWREAVKLLWPGECIDPMRRDYRGREHHPGIEREIVLADKEDIMQSAGMIVYFDKPSVGTAMEVFFAHSIGRPIVVVHRPDEAGTWHPISPWMRYHGRRFTTDLKSGVATISALLHRA